MIKMCSHNQRVFGEFISFGREKWHFKKDYFFESLIIIFRYLLKKFTFLIS